MERKSTARSKKRPAAQADIAVTRWDHEDPPSERDIYVRMEEEGFSPYLRGEPAGTRKPMHAHPFVEVLWVVSGWVRYTFPARDGAETHHVILKAGDRLELPANFAHETEVEGSAYLVYLTNSPYSLGASRQPAGVNI